MSATPKTTSGQVLAAMEACLRHAVARLQEGTLSGTYAPEPVSQWRVSWRPVDAETIDVCIAVGHPIPGITPGRVSERIRRLGFEPVVQFVLGGGVEWIIPMEVQSL